MPFVRHLGKTNMLTHIPEDIKLELKDGVLTLKAGSKVYVPNGAGKFDEVIIESDLTYSRTTTEQELVVVRTKGGSLSLDSWFVYSSGSSAPSVTSTYMLWYDTANNKIKGTGDNGATWNDAGFSLPIALITTSGKISSIDQVFNGFGYIGSTVFVLPNVKGLMPNGFNNDGSLKNIEFTLDKVLTRTITWNCSAGQWFSIKLEDNGMCFLDSTGNLDIYYEQETEPELLTHSYWYKPSENKFYRTGDANNLYWYEIKIAVAGRWFTESSSPYKVNDLPIKKVDDGIVRNKFYSLARRKRTYYKYGTEPNVTVVGSPTISNGVVSGFSSSNYLTVTKPKPTIKSFEQVLKIRTGSNIAARQTFLSHNPYKGFGTLQVLDSKLIAYVSSDGSSNNIINGTQSSLTLNTNTDYWIRYAFDGSKYRIDVSTNGQDYTNYITVNSSAVVYADGFFSFGLDTGDRNNNPFLGSIDFTQSYIKINGQDWWRGTKVVESTSTDYDYYKDNLVSYSPIVRGSRTYYKQSEKQRDTGTYTFTLNKDYTAEMLFVGNGGGGGSSANDSYWRNSSGGSGACFQGRVSLPKGTYTLTIGTLGYGYCIGNTANMTGGADSTDSYLTDENGNELIRVGCGIRGTVIGQGGAGGTLTLGTLEVLETTKAVNGNTGEWNNQYGQGVQKFAVSAYDGTTTGYGAGTSSYYGGGNVYGIKGIFDLALETDINDFDWYEDVGTKIY